MKGSSTTTRTGSSSMLSEFSTNMIQPHQVTIFNVLRKDGSSSLVKTSPFYLKEKNVSLKSPIEIQGWLTPCIMFLKWSQRWTLFAAKGIAYTSIYNQVFPLKVMFREIAWCQDSKTKREICHIPPQWPNTLACPFLLDSHNNII